LEALRLERNLVFFDLETTGIDPAADRIVEITLLRVSPAGEREERTHRVNPLRPIPAEATAIHGISDIDVADAPPFRSLAAGILDFLADADLGGFNILRFDVPLLERELRECGLDLKLAERRVVDAMTVFHRKESRNLTAAVRFYLGLDHGGAHGAAADTDAALRVLEAQLLRYPDLPRDVEQLAQWCRPAVPAGAVDRDGKFVWRDGEVVFSFGKYQGQTLKRVASDQRGYLDWILKNDFPSEARRLVEEALRGRYPEPPSQP